MKKICLLLSLMLLPLVVSALTIEIDGISYYVFYQEKTVSVVKKTPQYTGDVVIPDKVTYSGVQYSVTSIDPSAFEDCTGLTSITIPNSVTDLGIGAFYGCTGLTSITIGNSVTSIGERAFSGCFGLTTVTIPNSVTSIGNFAFYGCTGLTFITIPNSVTSIGDAAFSSCTGLTSITVDSDNMVYDSRDNCNAIIKTQENVLVTGCKNTTIPVSVTSIVGNAFFGCRGLTSITIPNSVTSIGTGAFSSCTGLTSITIPNSVTSIGTGAFLGCSGLTSITIPNSVTTIGDYVFFRCTGLTAITSLNTTPPAITEKTFSSYDATLMVPTGSKSSYESADYWKNFTNIEEIDVTGVEGIRMEKRQDGKVYDLNGRRLSAPTKGINVMDGKKVLMK